jgi:hypothetical protein
MATGTSSGTGRRRRAIWLAAALLAVIVGGVVIALVTRSPAPATTGAFGWLRPTAAPAGWRVAATKSGIRLAYPAGWRQIQSDRGTVSAAPSGSRGVFRGYLNATPRAGAETLVNWTRFRLTHLAEEGDRNVELTRAATGLPFHSGHGSCVIDSYSTPVARFREIACLVAGAHGTSVVIGAAPVTGWHAQAPLLERAVASFSD